MMTGLPSHDSTPLICDHLACVRQNEDCGTPIRRPGTISIMYRTSGMCTYMLVSPYVLISCLLSHPLSYLPSYFLSLPLYLFLYFFTLFLPSSRFFYFVCIFCLIPYLYFYLLLSLIFFVFLLISLSLPPHLSFGISFLICIYFRHCLFVPFSASVRSLPRPFTVSSFFLSLTFIFYSRCFFLSLFLPFLTRITFNHNDLVRERVNEQKSWLRFNPKFSVE
jgi:hypothetical protein